MASSLQDLCTTIAASSKFPHRESSTWRHHSLSRHRIQACTNQDGVRVRHSPGLVSRTLSKSIRVRTGLASSRVHVSTNGSSMISRNGDYGCDRRWMNGAAYNAASSSKEKENKA
ncbi:hypothetical protein SCLCIDRAFT_1213504 [Scleroderma citrinum Foug A]|uniref:Uncharacterized protein n=1 Tax=Scleroderma citrinum Foug A TaxID=1036808 RepID=A0A0C2ZRG0_9AGAM|nr:hypothetical protein SCLCIDRAFT_1213504 [Scleroderma citrinum Foug A]